ncbi:GNAT family N-acetyltransferase [Frateuria aurantia]
MQARFHDRIELIDAVAWDALRPDSHPFLSHAFLAGLEQTGCIRQDWGWQPYHLGLYHGELLLAAAPLYLKGNSHGEFVFDWSWADAWERAGGEYYPKLLNAVPYSPVPGPRLLAGDGDMATALRRALVQAMQAETERLQLSSLHANFLAPQDLPAFPDTWLARSDLQYHWHNHGYADFEAFLAALTQKKRKNIRQERRRISAYGLDLAIQRGGDFSRAEWSRLHSLYRNTFDEKGNHAALTPAMFQRFGSQLADQVRVATARRDGHIIAMALFLQGPETLYGRYWGADPDAFAAAPPGSASDPSPDGSLSYLHFELCYYLGIEYCIAEQLSHFEPGAQGQRHKMARGFMPTPTCSRHYLTHAGFRQAVQRALQHEAQQRRHELAELACHSPYLSDREPTHEPAANAPVP